VPSVRRRLLVLAVAWISLALLLAGSAISYLFVLTVERNVRAELLAGVARLVAVLDTEAATPRLLEDPGDPRYLIPFSGVYWQIEMTGAPTLRSGSLWDVVLTPQLEDGQTERFDWLPGPREQILAAVSRRISIETASGPRDYLVTAGADRSVTEQSIEQFGSALAAALLVLGAVLTLAAYFQVRQGLAPLDGLRSGIAAIRAGTRVSMAGTYPREVLPLVNEIEALLASQRDSIEFARERAADLAHGLKTPLAVLANLANMLRAKGELATAAQIEGLAAEMAQRVDYQLHLSRLRHRTRNHALYADLGEALSRTLAVVQQTQQGENLVWSCADTTVAVDIDPNDLIELLGVLLENAAKWAKRRVAVATTIAGDMAEITIEDDGPGLDAAKLASLGQRGVRLDEAGGGHGLGLAIASNIVRLNGGSLAFAKSSEHGLLVTLRLPLSRQEAGPPAPLR
jgi:signal transduction histidine kinase